MVGVPEQITGGCLCGNVRYRAVAEPILQGVCHCSDCQHQTGTAFSVFVALPREALTIEGSALASFTVTGEEHATNTERRFCSACGSPVVSFVDAAPDLAFLKVGTLDDASWVEPALEIWTRSAQPWSPRFEHAQSLERGVGSGQPAS